VIRSGEPGGLDEQGDGSEWQRFHPLSPLLRGGVTLAALAAWIIGNQFDTLFGAGSDLPAGAPLQWLALAAFAAVSGVVLVAWLSWRVSRFRVGESTLEVRTGLLFRQHRQVRYDRIQAVDIRRPLLARLAGLSEVRVQAAGGAGSDARLAFLPQGQAHEVRARLMALAGRTDEALAAPARGTGVHPAQTPAGTAAPAGPGGPSGRGLPAGPAGAPGPATEAETVVRVPATRLVQAALYRGRTVFLLGAVPTLVAAMALGRGGMVAFLGPAVLAVGGNAIGGLVREWNFELLRDPHGIHVRRGLTDLKASSVPVHRIQVVSVRQSAFWRLPDWWRVEVNVAGVGPSADDSDSVVLPVGTREEALRVVALLRPGAELQAVLAGMVGSTARDAERGPVPHTGGPDAAAGSGAVGSDASAGSDAAGGSARLAANGTAAGDHAAYTVAPERAAWLSPVVRSRHGFAVTPDAVLVRGGRARRFVHLVPHARIQALRLRQGPLQRRLRLADVELLSTPGQASPAVQHLDQDVAQSLLNAQVGRSSTARQPAR
jgi:putative membrane protein